jgi:LPS-assembly protein
MPVAPRRSLALLLACVLASSAALAQSAQPEQPTQPAQTQPPAQPEGPEQGPERKALGGEPVEITADALDYDASRDLYLASGNVVLKHGPKTLRADWMAFNRRSGVGLAKGHVELRQAEEVIRAESVNFDVNTLEGVVQAGEIDSPAGQFHAAGDEIQKTGERSYVFRGAVFTTCRCPEGGRDPWRLKAREANVNIGGYGTVRDATVEVLDVPVLWLPWLIVPLRTERQSGFLFPEISVASRRGFEVGTPFFWAARDNVNVTLTPKYSVRRGFKQDVQTEYVLGKESSGDVFASFAHDQEIEPNSLAEPYSRERWATFGKQDLWLPGDARFRSDFRFVSDNDYTIDFDELRSHRADRWLESWASVTRAFGASGRFGAVGLARYANDMQNPDDIDRDTSALQRLPTLGGAMLPDTIPGIPWLTPAFDVSYTYFRSLDRSLDRSTRPAGNHAGFLDTGPDGVFDPKERFFNPVSTPNNPANLDPDKDNFVPTGGSPGGGGEGDGRFEEGEPLTNRGSRWLMNPRLAAPFTLGGVVEVYPEAGWQQMLYATKEEQFAERGALTGRLDLRTRLRRQYGSLMHTLEPTVGFAYVNPTGQNHNPLFEPDTAVPQERIRTLDLDALTRDPADRLEHEDRVTFGALQRFETQTDDQEGLHGELTVLGSYEIEKEHMGLLVGEGNLTPPRFGTGRFLVGYEPESQELSEALVDWTWRAEAGHRISLGYRYLREIPRVFEDFRTGERFDHFSNFEHIQQITANLRFQATPRWLLGYRTSYSFERNELLQNGGLIEYTSQCGCWAAGVDLAMDRASGVRVRVLYRLVGVGKQMASSPLLDSLEGL